MSDEDENGEVKKARFYYETVVKSDEMSTRSYERTNTKINLFIGVLSTVIPILTGLGYVVLSNTIAVSFFVFYVVSLSIFVTALAKCVHLLAPRYFLCVDFGELMVRYEKKSLDFIIFKIAHTWEDAVKENVNRIKKLRSGLQQTVQLIIIGLTALVFSFVLLGIDYYLVGFLAQNEFLMNIISESTWRLVLFLVCVVVFICLIIYIIRYTNAREDKPMCPTKKMSRKAKLNPQDETK